MKKLIFLLMLAIPSGVALAQNTQPFAGNSQNRSGQLMISNEAVKMALLSMWRSSGHTGGYNDMITWLKGAKGDPGIQGVSGVQGIQGTKGDKGDPGIQGVQGVQGLNGDKGDKGDTGAQGIPGIQGVKGDTGSQGIPGQTGAKGDKGETGSTGAQGIQGLPGVVKVAGGSNTLAGTINVLAGATYSVNVTFTAPLTSTNYLTAVTLNGSVSLLGSVVYSGVTNKTLTGCTVVLKNNGVLGLNIATLSVEVIAFQPN